MVLRVCTWPKRFLFVKFPGQHMHLETTTAHEAPSTSVGEADGSGCWAGLGWVPGAGHHGWGHGCFLSFSLTLHSPCIAAFQAPQGLHLVFPSPSQATLPTLGLIPLSPSDPSSTNREIQKPHWKASSFKLQPAFQQLRTIKRFHEIPEENHSTSSFVSPPLSSSPQIPAVIKCNRPDVKLQFPALINIRWLSYL